MPLIYAIRSPQTDQYYVGSTTKTLLVRFSDHKSKCNTTSREIIKYGDAYIELIEECDIEVRFEREKYHIENGNVVNKYVPTRTEDENKVLSKVYYEANKDKIKAREKVRRETNKEERKIYMKAYREAHKEELKKKDAKRYEMKKIK